MRTLKPLITKQNSAFPFFKITRESLRGLRQTQSFGEQPPSFYLISHILPSILCLLIIIAFPKPIQKHWSFLQYVAALKQQLFVTQRGQEYFLQSAASSFPSKEAFTTCHTSKFIVGHERQSCSSCCVTGAGDWENTPKSQTVHQPCSI